MRTTLNIEDKLLEKAARLTGITEKTSLVRSALLNSVPLWTIDKRLHEVSLKPLLSH